MAENPVDIKAGLARKLRLIAVGVAMPQDRDARKALFDKAASAVDELRTAREENRRMRKVRDRLHTELTDLMALYGTHDLRRMNAFVRCVDALAASVVSGSTRPITLAHAGDVDSAVAALKGTP